MKKLLTHLNGVFAATINLVLVAASLAIYYNFRKRFLAVRTMICFSELVP